MQKKTRCRANLKYRSLQLIEVCAFTRRRRRTVRCRYRFWHNGIVRFLWHSTDFLYRPTSATVQMLKLHTVRWFSQLRDGKITAIAEDHGTRPISREKPWISRIRDYLTALRNATTPMSTNFGFEVRTTRLIFIALVTQCLFIIISKNTCVTALAIASDGV